MSKVSCALQNLLLEQKLTEEQQGILIFPEADPVEVSAHDNEESKINFTAALTPRDETSSIHQHSQGESI